MRISRSFCRDSGKLWKLWDSREPFPFRCCWGSLQLTRRPCGKSPLLSPDLQAARFMRSRQMSSCYLHSLTQCPELVSFAPAGPFAKPGGEGSIHKPGKEKRGWSIAASVPPKLGVSGRGWATLTRSAFASTAEIRLLCRGNNWATCSI